MLSFNTSNYVIFSMQRSGTNSFCSYLNKFNNTMCYYELLNRVEMHKNIIHNYSNIECAYTPKLPYSYKRNYTKEKLHRCYNYNANDPTIFLNKMKEIHFKNNIKFGYKIFPNHVPVNKLRFIVDKNTTCIILKRENLTAQYLSLKNAIQSGCWIKTRNISKCKENKNEIKTINNNYIFSSFLKKYNNWFKTSFDICRKNNIIFIKSEDYFKNTIHVK